MYGWLETCQSMLEPLSISLLPGRKSSGVASGQLELWVLFLQKKQCCSGSVNSPYVIPWDQQLDIMSRVEQREVSHE